MNTLEIVRTDEFDRDDMEQMLDTSPRLRSAADVVTDATATGEGLVTDLWSSLIRVAPRKVDEVPPKLRVNETVIDRIWEAQDYRDLHEHTMGDPVNTAAGVVSLSKKVAGMLTELADVAEQAEKAQEAQDALDEAMSGDGQGGPGTDEETLESLRSTATTESGLLDAMLDENLPKIDKAVRAGLEDAKTEADANAAAAAGWDLSPGDALKMDPAERIRLLGLLSTERMRRIAELVGLMHAMALGNRERRFELLPGEVYDVTLGDSLARLVPGELVALAIPELEDLLLLRLIQGQAMNYLTREVDRAGKGAIVFLGDYSGSMDGAKADWCAAFGLALLRAARDQGRAFHAICFRGKGEWQRFDFPVGDVTVDRMIEFASCMPNGGTEVTGPLDEAVGILQAEHDHGGQIEGDIVLATDGEVGVPPEWLDQFIETRERLQFNVYGLAIRARLSTLQALCTHVGDVTDLGSARDVVDIFESVY